MPPKRASPKQADGEIQIVKYLVLHNAPAMKACSHGSYEPICKTCKAEIAACDMFLLP
jgi:hypothetical protein